MHHLPGFQALLAEPLPTPDAMNVAFYRLRKHFIQVVDLVQVITSFNTALLARYLYSHASQRWGTRFQFLPLLPCLQACLEHNTVLKVELDIVKDQLLGECIPSLIPSAESRAENKAEAFALSSVQDCVPEVKPMKLS